MSVGAAAVIACAIAVAVLLWAEWHRARAAIWAAKLAASTSFLVGALAWGAAGTAYGRLVLLGLGLSWIGDALLVARSRRAFLAGLGAFLLAHLTYAAAFARQPLATGALTVGAAAMLAFGAAVLSWLWPRLDGRLRPAVVAYVAAISLMVTLASGATAAVGAPLLAGGVAFAVSDVFVARHRFVAQSAVNKLLGLPLYYAGQLLLAWTVAAGGAAAAVIGRG